RAHARLRPSFPTRRSSDLDSTVTALDNVTLDVAAGELVAIVGPSGSGKSSLLAVAGGLITPSSGTVALRDIDLTATPQSKLAERSEEHTSELQSRAKLVCR